MKNWLINIGYFLVLNLILLIVDGTPLVDNFTKFNNFGNIVLQTGIFTKWFNFYDTPFFNEVLLFALVHIIMFPFYQILFKKRANK